MAAWAIGVAYDGSGYHGWQLQDGLPTVQGDLEQALSRIANEPIRAHAAGRTDRGVHATGQVVGFSTASVRDDETWLRGLNGLTGPQIRVSWVREVNADFHARFSATARRYHYLYTDTQRFADPLLRGRVWHCQAMDADVMHRQAQALLGEQDFTSFRAAGCQSSTPMRRVHRATVARRGQFVVLEIEANAFLLHMVRNIASALHALGRGASRHELSELLALRDRAQVGATAPPDGLYLSNVTYPAYNLPNGETPALINALIHE